MRRTVPGSGVKFSTRWQPPSQRRRSVIVPVKSGAPCTDATFVAAPDVEIIRSTIAEPGRAMHAQSAGQALFRDFSAT